MNLEGFEKANYTLFTSDDDEVLTNIYIAKRDDGYKAFPILKDYVASVWGPDEFEPNQTPEQFEGVTSTISWYIIPVDDKETNQKFGLESEIGDCEYPLKATDGNMYYVYHVGGDVHQNTGHYPYEPR